VGVAPALIAVVTLVAGGDRHSPVAGILSQSDSATGKVAVPVSADAVIMSWLPTLTEATAKALEPVSPGSLTMPSPDWVAAKATMSDTGFVDADSKKVFTPGITAAGSVSVQSKANATSVEGISAVGVNEKT